VNWAAEVASTGISVQTVTGLVSLVLGIGAVAVGISKAVRGLRRFARLLDGFLGDGTTKHPSVPDRLSAMETNQEEFKTTQDELAAKVEALTVTVDHHVDGDAQKWLADGQAWGNRLDGQVADLGTRVSALEERTSG
jgi:hypothetical protein